MKLYKRIATSVLMLSAVVTALAITPGKKDNILLPQLPTELAMINTLKHDLPTITPLSEMQVQEEESPEYISDMLSYAGKFKGLRYRRGGKTPSGFDCSGFTSYIFRQFGVSLSASSRSQYAQGEKVKENDLRPGDLVFFGGRRGGKATVGHVGIVTTVNDDNTFSFIHSATSSGIIVSRSTEPYYANRYIGARRVTE
jgi:hypothetical protein